MLEQPALRLFAISAAVLGLHLIALAGWTGTVRARHKRFVNKEDAKVLKGTEAEMDHPDVLRVKRAHMNALENAVPFFAIGLMYAMTAPSTLGAQVYFGTFVAMRLLHSIFYLAGAQPFRTLTFGISALATLGMAVHVLRTTI